MCTSWKKKNERNEIVCFYCTQSDILLCGIARFSRGNNKLRTFQPQKWKKLRTASLKQNLLFLIKKECNFIKCCERKISQCILPLRKDLLKICNKFTEHPCRSLLCLAFALQLYWNHSSVWVFSCKFAANFQNTFYLRTPLESCFWHDCKEMFLDF